MAASRMRVAGLVMVLLIVAVVGFGSPASEQQEPPPETITMEKKERSIHDLLLELGLSGQVSRLGDAYAGSIDILAAINQGDPIGPDDIEFVMVETCLAAAMLGAPHVSDSLATVQLGEDEEAVFLEIVQQEKNSRFTKEETPILRSFVRSDDELDRVESLLYSMVDSLFSLVNGNPLLEILQSVVASLISDLFLYEHIICGASGYVQDTDGTDGTQSKDDEEVTLVLPESDVERRVYVEAAGISIGGAIMVGADVVAEDLKDDITAVSLSVGAAVVHPAMQTVVELTCQMLLRDPSNPPPLLLACATLLA